MNSAFRCTPSTRDRLADGRCIVRAAKPGETLETLDHVERILTPEMTVIADEARPVGLAGIMGGFDAEVTDDTTRILSGSRPVRSDNHAGDISGS